MRISNHLPLDSFKPAEKPAAKAKSDKLDDAASLELSSKGSASGRKIAAADVQSVVAGITASPKSALQAQGNLSQSRISNLLA